MPKNEDTNVNPYRYGESPLRILVIPARADESKRFPPSKK